MSSLHTVWKKYTVYWSTANGQQTSSAYLLNPNLNLRSEQIMILFFKYVNFDIETL